MTIKILLVDDHAVVRSGLSKFLMVNKELKLVGEASDGAEAVQMVSLHKPDIVLMDLMMPGMDGITATREIHNKYPKVKVIALTSFAEQNMVQGAFQAARAGARGVLQLPQLLPPAGAELQLAAQILAMEIKGLPVRKILVDEAANIETEIYFGITNDRNARRPVMIASAGTSR